MILFKLAGKACLYLLAVLTGLVAGWFMSPSARIRPAEGALSSGLTIEKVAELADLLVIKLDVSDVLVCHIEGRTGGVEVVVVVKGDVSLGVELATAKFENIDKVSRTAVLTLPQPVPTRPRLDHERTRVVLIQKEGLWQLSPSTGPYASVVSRSMAEAQELVASAGRTKEAEDRAKHHAEVVLQAFFRSLEWDVQIVWLDPKQSPAPADPGG